jgi:CelD/BcsL family acetyltransferase involved in cellulose biosynthesis
VRRADESGGFHFEVRSPTPGEADGELDDFVATEDRSWKGEAGTSLAKDARLQAFYRLYLRLAAEAGELRVARLRVGDALVAVQLAVERDGRLWILKLGCDERWSTCAPGIVLTHETLRWAFAHDLRGYELLGDEAPWTRVWTDLVHPHTIVRVYPMSIRGAVGAARDGARQARKRLARRSSE